MTGSSAWMLPLLLLALFVSFLQSKPVKCRYLNEFGSNVAFLGAQVTSCPENCSSVHTDSKCKCLHINVSPGRCNFPQYYIDGLNALNRSISNRTEINHMIKLLHKMTTCQDITFCPQNWTESYESVISPKDFHRKLELLQQRTNNQITSN